jgi:Novel STAND NTPase 1
LFFGRESAATDVLDLISRRLVGPGLLVVSGVSGSGKSSLLRAGVLLVVDQFEQLFTQCESEAEQHAFVSALHAAATITQGVRQLPAAIVVLVVRADFEARLADYPQLTSAVQDRYLLTSMTERQLRMAVTQPAIAADSSVGCGHSPSKWCPARRQHRRP